MSDYLILDTEGKEYLSEIAIIDSEGNLIYEAFTAEHPKNADLLINCQRLTEILDNLKAIATGKVIVCHYADHDRQVIENSYRHAKLPVPQFTYACTYLIAQQLFPALPSYSLANLCKHFDLRIDGKRFNTDHAHKARYDAQFTHQLYLKLQSTMSNPFDSSRVDTPFQRHPDFYSIYAAEYRLLKSILLTIQSDPNHQSRGTAIIGTAGSGKTHLIMRMAQELLGTNRLLFIRQPNNAQTVLYHTYSRILESFAETVPQTDHTQLELLIANSLTNILSNSPKFIATQKGKDFLSSLQNDRLNLYKIMGKEGTDSYRNNWQAIERYITEWWSTKYANAGNAINILRGIIRYCRYTDLTKKELTRRWLSAQELEPEQANSIGLNNWQDDMSREEFALEAIAVFGKLSVLDQPLIIVFDQLEGLGQAHNAPILESFGTAIKEILTHVPNSLMILNLFPDRWQSFQNILDPSVVDRISQYEIRLTRPSNEQLLKMLQQRAGSTKLEEMFSPSELSDILNQKSIRAILNRASAYYRHKYQHIPLPESNTQSREEQLEAALSQIFHILQPLFTAKPELPTHSAIIEEPHQSEIRETSTPKEQSTTPDTTLLAEYLQQKQAELDTLYHKPTIINEADDLGKLVTILETFHIPFEHLPLGKKALPELLLIPSKKQVIAFLHRTGTAFTARIKNFNELVLNYPKYQFLLFRDSREPFPTGQVTRQQIAALNQSPNGKFQLMEKSDRIQLELVYQTIIDIQNQDLEIDLTAATLLQTVPNSWITHFIT